MNKSIQELTEECNPNLRVDDKSIKIRGAITISRKEIVSAQGVGEEINKITVTIDRGIRKKDVEINLADLLNHAKFDLSNAVITIEGPKYESKISDLPILFPAGKYYIGDPCYVLDKKNWNKLCDSFFDLRENGQVEVLQKYCTIEYNKGTMFWGATAYGDGTYEDQDGHTYPVDAGLLSAIPVKCIDVPMSQANRYGYVISFNHDFKIDYKEGLFEFGPVLIDTRKEIS